jgi:hypothetical protein
MFAMYVDVIANNNSSHDPDSFRERNSVSVVTIPLHVIGRDSMPRHSTFERSNSRPHFFSQ